MTSNRTNQLSLCYKRSLMWRAFAADLRDIRQLRDQCALFVALESPRGNM
jgi:hypothetical protein